MTKKLSIALASGAVAFAAAAGSAERRVPVASAGAFLGSARPHERAASASGATDSGASPHPRRRRRRRLGDDFEVDGTYNLKFSQCVDVKLLDNDLFDEEVIEYTQAGQIISTKSYVLFHVCQEDDCYYESEDDLYLVDLATYVKNAASYRAALKTSYCEACDAYYYNYCAQQRDDAVAADDGAAADGGDDVYGMADDDYYSAAYDDAAVRRLATERQGRRRAKSYIDCDQCQAYGCIDDGDDNQQNKDDDGYDEAVVELIEDISQCLNTGLNWNDEELYLGFICSPYGGGVELAIFLDNQCTVYTNMKAFEDIPSWYIYNDEDMFAEAEAYIKSAFTETTSCLLEEFDDPANQVVYGDDDQYAANYNNGGGDDGYETNDYCGDIFAEGAIAFNSCVQNNDDANANKGQGNEDDNYNWYTYDMNYDDARDLEEVCAVLQLKEGEYDYQYDWENSGTWNDPSGWSGNDGGGGGWGKKSKGIWGFLGGRSSGEKQEGSGVSPTSPIIIFFYVILGVGAIVGVLFVIGVREKKRRNRSEPVYQGGKLV